MAHGPWGRPWLYTHKCKGKGKSTRSDIEARKAIPSSLNEATWQLQTNFPEGHGGVVGGFCGTVSQISFISLRAFPLVVVRSAHFIHR